MQVAFENVPGARELQAGSLDRGISITESELESENAADSGPLLANLCGAYVVTRALREAKRACEAAVDAEASPAAVNNRGVFRVLTGDFEGARRDFATFRPDDVYAYIEEIKRMDARFMAQENLILLDKVARHVALAGVMGRYRWIFRWRNSDASVRREDSTLIALFQRVGE